jgi:antitoxin PrlF
MITSKITSKTQTTIPQTVRDILGVGPGDELVYRIEDGRVILERGGEQDAEMASLTSLLSEWSAPENDVYDSL